MSTVDFNTLIYTASKSLKNADVAAPVSDDLNNMLQEKFIHSIQNKTVFKQDISIKTWFFNVLNKTFTSQVENVDFQGNPETNTVVSNGGELNDIHEVVNTMEKDMMIPFVMHFQGFKFDEIAKNLNLPIEVIQERIQSARMFLINQISE